ncbi:inner-Membrane translocator protein [Arthrobacter sp. Hiyo8]|nr:inner-Membrane translocator protein [Arthrobacter sp. Hiyo8]
MVSVLSVLLAIVLGGILMAVTNPKSPRQQVTSSRSRGTCLPRSSGLRGVGPGRHIQLGRADAAAQLYPITETLTVSTP